MMRSANSTDGFNTTFFYGSLEYWLYVTAVILSFTLGGVCLFFNSLTFAFYAEKRQDTLSLMYTALSACDLFTGVSALLNGASLVLGESDIPFNKLSYLFKVSIFNTSITSHVSVFYNLVLVVVRTLNIILPFYKTRTNLLKLSFIIYPLLWVGPVFHCLRKLFPF